MATAEPEMSATSERKQNITLAYVTQTFPLLTETFIYREVIGLQNKGFQVDTFAVWQPDAAGLSRESRHFIDSCHYVFPLSWLKFFKAHLHFFCRRPQKYWGSLFFVLTRRAERARNRIRTFFHFCEAVYLAREMKLRRINHIHAHFAINAATIALVAGRLLDIPYSFTAHNCFFTDRILLREKVREARFIIAISDFTRRFLSRLVPEDDVAGKIHIVHCGVSTDDFVPPPPRPENDVPLLLFVAQLVERKGAPILIEACRILAERGLKFRCLLAGDGPQKTQVERSIGRYSLGDRIDCIGVVFQEHLKRCFDQADIFVLPCITAADGDVDGVPVSLMEAMAMEIATVSTSVSGIPELIEDGVTGLLVPEKDETALADALQRLLSDDELRLRLGKKGRQKILDEFDVDKNTGLLAELFLKTSGD